MRQQEAIGIIPVRRLEHLVSLLFEHGERDLAHVAIVVDEKNGLCPFGHLPAINLRPQTAAPRESLPAWRPNSPDRRLVPRLIMAAAGGALAVQMPRNRVAAVSRPPRHRRAALILDRYAALLAQAFPARADGKALRPYPRLFFIATPR